MVSKDGGGRALPKSRRDISSWMVGGPAKLVSVG